jgi:thioredoxin-related protein
MKYLYFTISLLLGLLLCNTLSADYLGEDYNTARNKSLKNGETFVLLIWSDGCPPCSKLKSDILSSHKGGETFGANVVFAKWGSEVAKALKTKENSIPQIIRYRLLDGKWVRDYKIGYIPKHEFLRFCHGT